jgi:predicted Zn-dependent protease
MTREEMFVFINAILEQASVPDVMAKLTEERLATVRFGQNRITQNMDIFERRLRLTLGDGERQAVYSTHRIDIDAIPSILDSAMGILETASPDPEYMPPVEAGQVYPVVENWDAETARANPDDRTGAVAAAIKTAERNDMEASGITGVSVDTTAIGTSTGNLGFQRSTSAFLRLTMDRGKGSSYRSINSVAWRDLPVSRTVEEVAQEAEADMDQVDLEPGSYKLILEPQAVADLVPYIAWSLNARQADEGLTVFTGRQGEKVTGDLFTLSSMVNGIPKGVPFNEEGLASEDAVWIENGVLINQPCQRYWAKKTDREALFIPGTLSIEGGEGSTADLINSVDGRALLFRRFWYIRFVDQKEMSLTGMTRDGVFLVENGKIIHPVKDFRWNWKPLDLFNRIEILGTVVRKEHKSVPPMVISETVFG